MEIRDPIHGAIAVADSEIPVVDHAWMQRLRHIRQTGFSHVPFPGATHTRFSHSLGVMHLAGLAFDRAYTGFSFAEPGARDRFRQALRLAALCHDLGHAPFSHCMEFALPAESELGLRWAAPESAPRKATHEDYTVAILEQTDLGQAVTQAGSASARDVAALLSQRVTPDGNFFVDGGLNHQPLLSQIVSSELDVDRLDYLGRDALYTGTRYGTVDVPWLLSNLRTWVDGSRVSLAIDGSAVLAFEHFLLARHHMFLMVYFHHKSVVYEELLRKHVSSPSNPWVISADLDQYRRVDDVALLAHLRTCTSEAARRIVEYQPYRRLVERQGTAADVDLTANAETLRSHGIDVIHTSSTQRLSRYAGMGHKRTAAPPIWVLTEGGRQSVTLDQASRVFERYGDDHVIARLYVPPEDLQKAQALR